MEKMDALLVGTHKINQILALLLANLEAYQSLGSHIYMADRRISYHTATVALFDLTTPKTSQPLPEVPLAAGVSAGLGC